MASLAPVGIALSAEEVCAVLPGGRVWRRALPPAAEAVPAAEALREALEELRRELDSPAASCEIALLPPLAHLRRVELPRLPEADLRRILARDLGRFVPGARGPHALGLERLPSRGAPLDAWRVAAAPGAGIDSLREAAVAAGWRVARLVPAAAAWAAAAETLWPAPAGDAPVTVIVAPDRMEVSRAGDERFEVPRRLPRGEPGEEAAALSALAAEGDRALPVALVAPDGVRAPLAEALRARGHEVREPAATPHLAADPEALAAAFAGRARSLELVAEGEFARRGRRRMRAVAALAAASLLLLGAAGSLRLWDARRELEAVRERRLELREEVSRAMAARDSLLAVTALAQAVGEREGAGRRWSIVLADLAPSLPPDAHITSFRAEGDTVALAGVARDALGVVRGLYLAPGVEEVRSEAPVRRELGEDGAPMERFELSVRVRATALRLEPPR